jgi:DNA-binding NtrC family response regulator
VNGIDLPLSEYSDDIDTFVSSSLASNGITEMSPPANNPAVMLAHEAAPMSLSALSRVSASEMAKLLFEVSARDASVQQRLRKLLAEALPADSATQPSTANHQSPAMIGNHPRMKRIVDAIGRYALSGASVLILGESGTGKELVARAIHERSAFKDGPFIAINCGALPTTLIGSELFGHEKGAFTGAVNRKIGRIESAAGGTVFLDEIGDLPFEVQAHLLRFLQEGTIERIGGGKSITVNARVIAATHVDLRKAVAAQQFRGDLFYRLHVLTMTLPPLRERGDDILLLAHFFLERLVEETGRPKLALSPDAACFIAAYPWPGNVRELIASLRRAVVMEESAAIQVAALGLHPIPHEPADTAAPAQELSAVRATAEMALIRATLERNNFNIKRSAAEMGVSRVTLYRAIERYGIAIARSR